MVGAEIRRYSTDRRGLALNVFLGLAGGSLGALAETLVVPTVVLAFFVGQLTDSYAVVGLVPALGIGLWLLARLPAAILVGRRRRKLPWAIGASLIRAASTALLAAVCFRAGSGAEPQLLRAFFICYVAYSFASGFASVPTQAVLAKAIPQDRRELFFRQRNIWSGIFGLIAGLVVAQLLGNRGPAFPRDYALLFLAATVCQLATAFFVATLREPVRVANSGSTPLGATLGGVSYALADPNFRRFLFFRSLLSLSALADPFFVIFAVSELAIGHGVVGGYVIALVLGRLLSAPLWAGMARRVGERGTLQVAALVRLLPPLVALLLPYLVETSSYRDRISGEQIPAILFGLAFLAIGVSLNGQSRANHNYLAEIAPHAWRPAYVGTTNAALALVAVAPVAGGVVVQRSGYAALFLIAALVCLVSVFASGALTDTHVRTRPTAEAWRLRRATAPITSTRRRG